MAIYQGVVHGDVVVLPDGIHLEEGLHVEIHAPPPNGSTNTSTNSTEDGFMRAMQEAGLVSEVTVRAVTTQSEDRRLLHVKGTPLSQTIIEDRR